MITCRYRFKEIGWSAFRNEYDPVICEGKSLMAFNFASPDLDVRYYIGSIKKEDLEKIETPAPPVDENGEPIERVPVIDQDGIVVYDESYTRDGKTFRFEDKTGYYISIRIVDKEVSIFYRVHLNKTGWTEYKSDGALCGELKDEDNFITGIQVFSIPKSELDDAAWKAAEKKADERVELFNRLYSKAFLYADCNFRYVEKATVNGRIERDLEVKEVENGIILPLRELDMESRDAIFEGGVTDENFGFVAGLKRKGDKQTNMTVLASYKVDRSEVEQKDEEVIYGGVIFPTARRFGHMLIETMSRLWYVVEGNSPELKIAFVILPESREFADTFFRLLGIDMSRVMVIEKPTQFRKVIIPEQAFILFSNYHDKFNVIYDKMMEAVEAKEYKKLYLTRRSFTRYDGANDGINEEYLEEFFKKRGYEIISPEQHSVEEQIAYMKGADEVVCSEGTLSHLGLFCKRGTRLTILRRSLNSHLIPQFMINEMRGLDAYYVDAHYNILPDSHVDSVFLFGPSKCFTDYLDALKISYTPDEVKMDMNLVYEYILRYTENFSDTERFESISKYDIFDLIQTLNRVINGKYLSRFDYETKTHTLNMENMELTRKVEKLEAKLEKSEKERKELLNSKSWKLTKPLRALTNKNK